MRLTLGTLLTISYIFGFGYVLFLNQESVNTLKLNEWGDLLAGTFAPVAFFWFILAYLQQGQELRENTKALEAQKEQHSLNVLIASYTALLNHQTKEHALFSSFGDEYKGAARNARAKEKEYSEKIALLLERIENEKN